MATTVATGMRRPRMHGTPPFFRLHRDSSEVHDSTPCETAGLLRRLIAPRIAARLAPFAGLRFVAWFRVRDAFCYQPMGNILSDSIASNRLDKLHSSRRKPNRNRDMRSRLYFADPVPALVWSPRWRITIPINVFVANSPRLSALRCSQRPRTFPPSNRPERSPPQKTGTPSRRMVEMWRGLHCRSPTRREYLHGQDPCLQNLRSKFPRWHGRPEQSAPPPSPQTPHCLCGQ